MTDRLCILDDEKLLLRPVSLRFWIGVIVLFISAAVFAVSAGAWYIVRADYISFNATIHEAVARNDRLMAICVKVDEQAKTKARKLPLGIGGE